MPSKLHTGGKLFQPRHQGGTKPVARGFSGDQEQLHGLRAQRNRPSSLARAIIAARSSKITPPACHAMPARPALAARVEGVRAKRRQVDAQVLPGFRRFVEHALCAVWIGAVAGLRHPIQHRIGAGQAFNSKAKPLGHHGTLPHIHRTKGRRRSRRRGRRRHDRPRSGCRQSSLRRAPDRGRCRRRPESAKPASSKISITARRVASSPPCIAASRRGTICAVSGSNSEGQGAGAARPRQR